MSALKKFVCRLHSRVVSLARSRDGSRVERGARRWIGSRVASLAQRRPRRRPTRPPLPAGAPASDRLILAFAQLCRMLERPFPLAEIRAAAPAADGVPAVGGVLLAAERLGFKARAVEPSRHNLARAPVPFLLAGRVPGDAWLATGRVQDHVLLLEPDSERTTACSLEAVADLAERIVLLKPLAEPAQARWRETMLARLRPVFWELGIASVVINLLALATPLFPMTVYNKVINHGALQTLDVLVFGMVTLFLFEWALRALRSYVASHTGARLDAALGSEVVHHLVHLPLRTFERMATGQILERTRQLDSIRQFFASQMPLLLVDLAFVGLFLLVICYLDLRLGAITLAAMPLFWLLSVLARSRHHGLSEAGFKAAAAKASSLGETISQALTVKALGLEPEMERRFKQRLADAATNNFQAGHLGGMIASSGQVLQQGVALLIVYVGARAIIAGELSIGALIAATILAARALAPMRQVVGAWQQLHTVRAAFARLDELLNEPTERAAAPGPALQVRCHLTFEGVVYRYSEDAEPALEGIDLEIAPGQVLGVAGPPGSGKSTFTKLLCGLDHPERGRILLDDLDLRLWSPAVLRQQIGVVPQEVQLFSGTIAENIGLGAVDRQFERIVAAAKFVGAHDFIQRLPAGYDTWLGERGSGLSAGQRQLISIARALIRNPRLLVLDEATSALDGLTEQALLTNLKRASRGRTVVMVTHRLGALAIADRVLFLVDGRVQREGTPGEIANFVLARQPPEYPMRPRPAPA